MRVESLYYIMKIVETGNFSSAAKALYLSQPALSQAVKRLETELGVTIFTRQKGGVHLTEAGKHVLSESQIIVEARERLLRSIAQNKQAAQTTMRVGASPLYQKLFLSHVQAAFANRYPSCQVQVQEGYSDATIAGLLSETLDLGMINAPCPSHLVSCLTLFTEELFIATPIGMRLPIANAVSSDGFATIDLSSLRDEGFVAYSAGRRLDDVMEKICANNGFKPRVVLRCDGAETVNRMIADGVGVGIVPALLVKNCSASQRAAYYHISGEPLTRTFILARNPKRPFLTAAREFVAMAEGFNII